MIHLHSEARQSRDPGLQAERTALSWNRTGLAVLTNALLALRSGWVHQQTPVTLLALALLLASASLFFYGEWRRRQLLDRAVTGAPSALAMVAVAAVSLIACLSAIVSIALQGAS